MLKLSDLALRPDLQLGPMLVSPSRRLVEGPGGHDHLEPLIMQVFLLLIDAGGKVVTRNELFDQCWGGVVVGDDSLNRAILKVRRTGAHVAPGLFEIETIPRTGYRLTGDILGLPQSVTSTPKAGVASGASRRTLVIGGLAAAAALGTGGFVFTRIAQEREFNDLMERGEQALATSDPDSHPAQYFREAVALRPNDAKAQGCLAYAEAIRTESGAPDQTRTSLEEAEKAAAAAFALNPDEPNAYLARLLIESGNLDLSATENGIRRVLALDPDNLHAMKQLWNLLQCVGRSQDALALVQRSLAIKPLASGSHFPHAQLLWITGRTAEADRVIERAIQTWPTHRFVRFARFIIFAFTDRPRAALAMIEKRETAPQNFSPESIALWRVTLPALETRSSSNLARARQAVLDATAANLGLTSQSALVMSALGELDTAFELTDRFFAVGRAGADSPKAPGAIKSTAWRFAPWLFTPPIAAMRVDPRFDALVDQIGLSAYWQDHHVKPDYRLRA